MLTGLRVLNSQELPLTDKQIVTLLRGSSPAWEYRTAGFGGTLGASELVKLDPQNANFRQLNADLTNAARAYENAVINLDKQPSANDGISFVLGISYLNQDKQQRNLGYSMATVSAIHAQQTAEGIYKLLGEEAFRTELSRAGSYIRKTQHNDESGWNKVWTRIPHGDWQALYGNQKVDAKEKNFISDLKYEFRGAGIQAVISSGTVVVGDISLSGPYAPKGNYQKGKK